MEKKIEDYLHLYLGCEVEYQDRVGRIYSYYHPAGEFKTDRVWVCSLEEVGNPEMSCSAPANEVKPILRLISDMTNEEFREWQGNFLITTYDAICSPLPFKDRPKHVIVLENRLATNTLSFIEGVFLLSKGFDLFGLIEAGLAIEKTKITSH